MKAAVYYNNHDVRVENVPRPQIGADEVLVRVMASGICGSDVLEWYRIKKAPIVLGHEIAGTIEEVGSEVSGWSKGDRVVVSHHVPCNTCRYCLNGDHTVCETLHTTNIDPGGFCEYARVPAINVNRGLFHLPDDVSFEAGSFCEPLACVVRGQRQAQFRPGQTVLILGSGISGLLHLLLARANGAERVITTDLSPFKLAKAKELGADAAIDARTDVPAMVREANSGRLADKVIVCTGAMPAFEQAMKSVDRAGTILCFATTEPGADISIPINEFWRDSVTVMSSYANSPDDLKEAMSLIESHKVDVMKLMTHQLPLSDAKQGFSLMSDPSSRALKIVLNP